MSWKIIEFLQELKECFDIRRLMDYKKLMFKSICLLRHDIDHDINEALKIGKIEYSLGIQSTYFVLHDATYYGDNNFIKNCLELQDMGHEIGFHNNLLTTTIKTGYDIKDLLEKELNYLKNNNINIFGTAAHGDPLCRRLYYTNYEIFKDCSPPYKEKREALSIEKDVGKVIKKIKKAGNTGVTLDSIKGIKLHTLDLKDYGLYEAYFLPRDFYVTDCQDKWIHVEKDIDEWHPDFRPNLPKCEDIVPFLKEVSKDKIVLQALIHPNLKLIEI